MKVHQIKRKAFWKLRSIVQQNCSGRSILQNCVLRSIVAAQMQGCIFLRRTISVCPTKSPTTSVSVCPTPKTFKSPWWSKRVEYTPLVFYCSKSSRQNASQNIKKFIRVCSICFGRKDGEEMQYWIPVVVKKTWELKSLYAASVVESFVNYGLTWTTLGRESHHKLSPDKRTLTDQIGQYPWYPHLRVVSQCRKIMTRLLSILKCFPSMFDNQEQDSAA